jgi:hypothetical protein
MNNAKKGDTSFWTGTPASGSTPGDASNPSLISILQKARNINEDLGKEPAIPSVQASVLPFAFARKIAKNSSLTLNEHLVKINYTGHAKAKDAFERLVSRAEFAGNITPGQQYYMIADDFVSLGSTIADLRNYIEQQGGNVLLPKVGANSNLIERVATTLKKSGYTTYLIYNGLPMERAMQRNIGRINTTRRLIDPEHLLDYEYKLLQTYLDLKERELFDGCEAYSNDVVGGEEAVRLESFTPGGAGIL